MKKVIVVSILFMVIFQAYLQAAQHYTYYPPELGDLILQAQEKTMERDYVDAIKACDQAATKFLDSPIGHMGKAVIYQIMMFEEESNRFDKEYYDSYLEALNRFEKLKERGQFRPWEKLIAGGLYGLDGLYFFRKEEWFKAVMRGRKALTYITEAKKEDSSLFEVDIALGAYEYFRSKISEDHWWIPAFSNRKQVGIDRLEFGIKNTVFGREPARMLMMFVYKLERQYEKALIHSEALNKKSPNNLIARIFTGRIDRILKRYDEAQKIFEEINKEFPQNFFGLYHLAYTLQLKGKDIENAKIMYLKAIDAVDKADKKEAAKIKLAYCNYRLGEIYLLENDKRNAQQYTDRAFEYYAKLKEKKYQEIDINLGG